MSESAGRVSRIDALRNRRRANIDDREGPMYQNAPSTTGEVWILRTEAELLADGVELDNPHIPASEDLLEEAVEQIEADGYRPAWEVVDGDE